MVRVHVCTRSVLHGHSPVVNEGVTELVLAIRDRQLPAKVPPTSELDFLEVTHPLERVALGHTCREYLHLNVFLKQGLHEVDDTGYWSLLTDKSTIPVYAYPRGFLEPRYATLMAGIRVSDRMFIRHAR